MSGSEQLTIRELSPEALNDYLAYFDTDAFADNPRWASCYCFFNHFPHHRMDWERQTVVDNRAGVTERINGGQMRGYLAYLDGKVVGWCNANARESMTTLPDVAESDAGRIGSIACFIIAQPYRGQGVASHLLDAACEGFRRQGLLIAEAYPRREVEGEAGNYHGPLVMFLAAGFEEVEEVEGTVIVRKQLL